MTKYETLVNILDQLRSEAPVQNKKYYPIESDIEKVNQARSRAFIHLFLKVKFGLLDFSERERLITDKGYDAGIDAYYIDKELRIIYFLQSKFRSNEVNFISKEIEFEELLNMDVDRITDGKTSSEEGIEYNGKIKQLLRDISSIDDIGKYSYEVIILANLKETPQSKLKKLTGGFATKVYNFDKTYQELMYPVIVGTYYNLKELKLHLNLSNKTSSSARISYKVFTENGECEISVLFVPTLEIAKALYKYKNSVLKFNPRSYLELANNRVNREIAKTITDRQTNEFALFNNGITMLSYGTEFSERIGKLDTAQLIINQPQIINGGQTAFTLSRLYEQGLSLDEGFEKFQDKELLLKVITFIGSEITEKERQDHLRLIEEISKATNQQSPVDEADRRSNDKVQVEIQDAIFNEFGYFYERKRGEFADGIKNNYISRDQIINRDLFIRLCKCCDIKPAEARRSSGRQLFDEQNFINTLNNVDRYKEYFSAYKVYLYLNKVEKTFAKDKNNFFGVATYGNALRYGKFAVISVCSIFYQKNHDADIEHIANNVLSRWIDFEEYVSNLKNNSRYFNSFYDTEKNQLVRELNFDNYYKGVTLSFDVIKYFG